MMHHPNPASARAEALPDLADDLYLALLHSLSEGMCFLDPKGAIRFWNRAAEEISGFTATEALGARKLDDILSYCDETGHAMTVAPVIETLADRKERTGRLFLPKTAIGCPCARGPFWFARLPAFYWERWICSSRLAT